ncbi:MAG TPA: hypothetical protein VMU43_06940 [Candidatus Acidoferrum sp.]|nr:hypothetical protein [Candidatus Acidoferrum sp.]
MRNIIEQLKSWLSNTVENPKVRKRGLIATAVFLILQIYFVRELIAAELLFVLAFVVCLALAGIFYVVGTLGERSFDLIEAGVKAASGPTRRGIAAIEEYGRKSVRHISSESAH